MEGGKATVVLTVKVPSMGGAELHAHGGTSRERMQRRGLQRLCCVCHWETLRLQQILNLFLLWCLWSPDFVYDPEHFLFYYGAALTEKATAPLRA